MTAPLLSIEDLRVHFTLPGQGWFGRGKQVVRAVDGVSLTVNEVEDDVFGVNLIPHTWEVTTLGDLVPGTRVNLEIDMLARYVARLAEFR